MIEHAYSLVATIHNKRGLAIVAAVSLMLCACQTMTQSPTADRRTISPTVPSQSDDSAASFNRVGIAPRQVPPQRGAMPARLNNPRGLEDDLQAEQSITLVGHDRPIASGHGGALGHRRAGGCSTCGSTRCSGRFHQPPSLPETIGFSNIPPDAARDELLCNGGDRHTSVAVRNDWSVVGLQSGDTVAHYDTIDGKTFVEPSNDVCIYAPRFAAVRRVSGVLLHEQHQRSAGVELPTRIIQQAETQIASTAVQPLQPIRSMSINAPNSFREETRGLGLDNADIAVGLQGNLKPYEDLGIIRRGVFDDTEKARLATSLQAAVAWSSDTMLQVVMDGKMAYESTSDVGMQEVLTYELPQGKSRLRIVKIADKQNAKSGDIVSFTLRFDNVGDQTIGNVTVIDDLSRRLEYVEDSQECSLKADFFTQPNEGESLTLRWEVIDPMQVGEGGVIRFKCRVR